MAKSLTLSVLRMDMHINLPFLAAGLLLSLTTTNAEAVLTPYTSAGQSLVYSSVSDVTWTGDANLLGAMEASSPNLISTIINAIGSVTDTDNAYDTPANSGSHALSTADFGANGRVNWFGAQAYVSYLNTIIYAGSNQWALPTAGADPQLSYNQTDNQFGQLYYNELNKLAPPYPGYGGPFGIFGDGRWGTAGTAGPFSNAQSSAYWSGTEVAPNPSLAWIFFTYDGYLDRYFKNDENLQFFAWAVSPGQVSAVPIPEAVWLMGSGLLGLLSLKRRRHAG